MSAINVLKLLKEENKQVTYFFPVVSFGYIYAKGYMGVCNYSTHVVDWSYSGMPRVVYAFLAVVSILTGIMVFRYSNMKGASGNVVDSYTGYSILTAHFALEVSSFVALALRLCLDDLFLWVLSFLTLMTLLVNTIGQAN